jgi:hypothetical protein
VHTVAERTLKAAVHALATRRESAHYFNAPFSVPVSVIARDVTQLAVTPQSCYTCSNRTLLYHRHVHNTQTGFNRFATDDC